MIPPEGCLEARRTAPFHIQMELTSHTLDRGTAQIAGRVVRVFRTDGRLAEGNDVTFEIRVCEPGDEPTGPAYIYTDELAMAVFMEAYLTGSPPDCEIAAYEFTFIDAPTDQPFLNPGQLEELLKELNPSPETFAQGRSNRVRWWQFWRSNRDA